MIQGVLFDMDGILFDTEKLSLEVSTQLLQRMGYTMPDDYAATVCGASNERFCTYMRESFGEGFDFDSYYADLHVENDKALANGVPPMPHLHEALAALKAMGLKMAVASSTRYNTVLHHLEDGGIREYFDTVIGGDMVENTKPDPTIFRKAAEGLGLAPEVCVAVEDSVNGIRAAYAAGCVTVMIPDMMPPTDELREKSAAVLGSLAELPGFIQGLNQ